MPWHTGEHCAEIYDVSIMLTHWGRMDLHHESNTAFTPDNYSQEYEHPMQPGGWLHLIKGHPCYTPGKVGRSLVELAAHAACVVLRPLPPPSRALNLPVRRLC